MANDKIKAPAFMLYAADFIADENVMAMSNEEVGCYIKLICYCWREGSIPSDIKILSKLCQEDIRKMEAIWTNIQKCFFRQEDGRFNHARLSAERAKQAENRVKRTKASQIANNVRWRKLGASQEAVAPGAKAQAKEGEGKKSDSEYSDEFLEAYELYPNSKNASKKDAWKAWRARIVGGVSAEIIIAGVKRYAEFCRITKREPQFIKNPKTFFGPGEHYLLEYSAGPDLFSGTATPLPDNFEISKEVEATATSEGFTELDKHFRAFVSDAKSRGARYVDWNEALLTAIRTNKARIFAPAGGAGKRDRGNLGSPANEKQDGLKTL